ncbi:MAG: ABC transporter permease subunit [Acidimicrobiales bacterium]
MTATLPSPAADPAGGTAPAAPGAPVVQLDGVRRRFGQVDALAGLDLAVPANRITVLLTLKVLPQSAQSQIQGTSDIGRTAYALAVFLLAPVAIVVPLTISTAIGASTIVGERERGTGEFLAHSPAHEREIYLGKLIASLVPGYATTLAGFGIYSIIATCSSALRWAAGSSRPRRGGC